MCCAVEMNCWREREREWKVLNLLVAKYDLAYLCYAMMQIYLTDHMIGSCISCSWFFLVVRVLADVIP